MYENKHLFISFLSKTGFFFRSTSCLPEMHIVAALSKNNVTFQEMEHLS